jgi:hypothetical protein
MILDRFIKIYSINTDKSLYNIQREIEEKTKKQSRNILLLATNSINYKQFRVIDNMIEIERYPNFFNPMRGSGNITFNLTSIISGTTIECKVVPSLLGIIFNFAILLLFLITVTVLMFSSIQHIYFETIIFMTVFWIFPLNVYYFVCKLNTTNLDSYARLILYDLEILHPDN